MDGPQQNDTDVIVEDEPGGRSDGEADRDLRDVLAHLVVAGDGRDAVSVRDVAAAVGGSDRLLPELLGALEDDATAVRIGAAWTLCALADERPKAAGYMAERVTERMDGGEESFEVGQVLSYLRGRYPGRVADAIDVAVDDSLEPPDERESRGDRSVRDTDAARAGDQSRSGPAAEDTGPEGKRIETDGGVPAGTVSDLGDGRQVVRPDGGETAVHQRPAQPQQPGRAGETPTGPERLGDAPTGPGRGPADPPSESTQSDSDPPTGHPTHPDFASSADANAETRSDSPPADSTDLDSPDTPGSSPPLTDPQHRPETPETFASIGALSSFDQLSAVDEGVEDRYASSYRSRAVTDGDQRGVAIRLFDRPDEADRLDFRADLEDALARWQALGDADCVVGVTEWGDRPRPWVATQPVDGTLVDRDRPPVDEALQQALVLAEAVGHLHHHGTVHGGIDPKSVVFPGDTLEGLDRPMFDNVGLLGVFRRYFDPREYLDPRFAAPEYYDDSFGAVDDVTDVYQLGAVAYLLCTGRPPYTGSYAEVRRGVLEGCPPAPTSVNDALPDGVDGVLSRALAQEKLKRYESVDGLARNLRRVRDRVD